MAKTADTENMKGKREALEAARLQIDKQFGKGSLMKLGDNRETLDVEVIPSGSIMLDEALGVGGYPKGRIIEIYGPESSGKTTLALHAIAESQKRGGIAAFIYGRGHSGRRGCRCGFRCRVFRGRLLWNGNVRGA